MKPSLFFATLSMLFALPQASAVTEIEALRTRCAEQEQQIRRLEEQLNKLQPAKSVTSSPSIPSAAAAPSTYIVRAGDSLERISRRNHCSPIQLAKANGIKLSAVIHPGQKLKLPGTGSQAAQTAQTTPPAKSAAAPRSSAKTHKIAAGDTLARISRKYGVSIESLLAANPEVKPTALRPGQVIRLAPGEPAAAPVRMLPPQTKPATQLASTPPRTETPATPQPKPTPAPAPAPAAPAAPTHTASTPAAPITAPAAPSPKPDKMAEPAATSPAQEQAPASNPEKKIRSVTIEGEMTYGEFAAKHGTDTHRLNELNGLDLTTATVLAKGSELYVPAQP